MGKGWKTIGAVFTFLLGMSALLSSALWAADEELESRARAIHQRVMTLDTHVDIPFDFATATHDPASHASAQVNLQKMREGGLDAAFFIVYVGQEARSADTYEKATADALTKFEAIHRMSGELYPNQIGLADTAAEVRALHDQGKLVALIGVENGFVIGKDLSLLADFRARGARYMTLVHNGHNDIGDSAQPRPQYGDMEEEHGGLSEFGYRVVDELNRLGILVDISHVSRQTMLDATRYSKAPVIASHSSVSALADHPRNLNDEQLLAVKENGGVVQVVAFDSYVKLVAPEKQAALAELRQTLGMSGPGDVELLNVEARLAYDTELARIDRRWPAATLAEFVDHIDYAVKLIGVEHVGIASDFGGGGGIQGWNDATETFNVTLELLRLGYSEQEVAMLWGGNVLRILEAAEKLSASMGGSPQ